MELYQAALSDLDVAAACHWEAHHGDPLSPEGLAWSYLEAHGRLAVIGLVEGLAKARK